jgi:uncharacterized cofD-like protein
VSEGPAVVALGGGHGLATALRGIRTYAGRVTAVVSVADDGGSSGRLRRDLGGLPPGDLRRCLVALADDPTWAAAFEHRFAGGELDGHALGNLVVVGLAETLGDFTAGLDAAGAVLRAAGRVLPATTEPVVLKATIRAPGGGSGDSEAVPVTGPDDERGRQEVEIEGQVAVQNSRGIRRVELVPADAPASPAAVEAIAAADQIVLAPGSLYTSLLPVLCVPELRAAIAAAGGHVVQVANLRPQLPETAGLDGTDQLRVVLEHGARVDTFLHATDGALAVDEAEVRELGVEAVGAPIARADGVVHDSGQLAKRLSALL